MSGGDSVQMVGTVTASLAREKDRIVLRKLHDPQSTGLTKPSRALVVAALWLLAALAALAQPPPGRPIGPRLSDFWVRWAADLAPLMSEEERSSFFALERNAERERFAQAFWRSRGEGAAERWGANSEEARLLLLESSRRQAALLLGKPSRIETFPKCGGVRRLEVWRWEPQALAGQGAPEPVAAAVMVFVRATSLDARSLRPWRPGDLPALTYNAGIDADLESVLTRAAASPCFEAEQVDRLREALDRAAPLEWLRQLAPWPEPASDWLRDWRQGAAEGDLESWPDARLELSFPGAFNDLTILQGRIVARAGRLHQLGPGQLFDRITITGDVYRGSHLADSFEIVHHVAGAHAGPQVSLEFYRRLRPASYTLDLRVVDRHGLTLLSGRIAVEVPVAQAPAPPPAGRARGYSHLTRPDVISLTTFPGVELLPVSAEGHGALRLHASTTGGPIDAVEFRLDGKPIAVDDEPPYSATIDSAGERRLAEAIALDPAGRPLARSQRWVEPEERAFYARFNEPAEEHVPVAVSLPAGARIDRVECLHGRQPTATLTDPPWRCPLPERLAARADYLTVRVTLSGGDTAEDVMFLGPGVEEIDVRLAELYLSVVDSQNRPAARLGVADFRLRDRQGELRLESAESLADLPLNVSLLMDISSSMGRDVRLAADSAQRFFEEILGPGDLASLLAFSHDLHRLAPFTGDAQRLRHASAGLRGRGSTRLHDAIVYALYQFSGLGNRRALIVLSDGADVGSDYPFAQVLDEAVRARVAVYPVFLGDEDGPTREQLQQLAARTGGRWFAVRSATQLDGVLRQIANELRAQYLLVFRPRSAARDLAFRQIEVELLRPGLKARDIHGHYR
jgi:VWFA-related protein